MQNSATSKHKLSKNNVCKVVRKANSHGRKVRQNAHAFQHPAPSLNAPPLSRCGPKHAQSMLKNWHSIPLFAIASCWMARCYQVAPTTHCTASCQRFWSVDHCTKTARPTLSAPASLEKFEVISMFRLTDFVKIGFFTQSGRNTTSTKLNAESSLNPTPTYVAIHRSACQGDAKQRIGHTAQVIAQFPQFEACVCKPLHILSDIIDHHVSCISAFTQTNCSKIAN